MRDRRRAGWWWSLLALLACTSAGGTEVTVTEQRLLDLGGAWQFAPDPGGRLAVAGLGGAQDWRAIEVPSCWEAQFPDLIDYDGVAWYRRTFSAPAAWNGYSIRLRFGAVDYYAEVWLNGERIGAHEGGYTPFAFDVTRYIRLGEDNTVVVRVTDPTDDRERFPDFPLDEVPSGKQKHYCQTGGIWQGVWLEARPNPYVELVQVTPDIDGGAARVRVGLAWPRRGEAAATAVRVRVLDADGDVAAERTAPIEPSETQYHLTLPIPGARLWEPDDPYLYTIEAAPTAAEGPTETVRDTFGMRKIEARDCRIYLNNHPLFLAGALDQAFYPRTIYAEPSDAELEDQFRQAKHLGLNFLRTHVKVPDPRYCAAADRVGLLLWMDMPDFRRTSPAAQARLAETLRETIRRDFNHPSIFAWCLINEEWGVPFGDPAQRAWLKGLWQEAKRLDPTRLVIDNSPAGGGHVIGDVEDQHVYMAMPERRREFERWCDEFAAHPAYTFRWPESERRGFEPLIISEFGNWGLPEIEPILDFYGGEDPYWFNQSSYGGPIRPGVERFREWGLEQVFGSFDAMAREMQWHQYASLKAQIEIMRRHPGIVGYVITQFTDLNSESNGLLDMTRRPKQYGDALGAVQAQDALVPVWERCAFWPGEEVALPVVVSHFSTREIREATLRWSLDGQGPGGEVKGITVAPATAREMAPIRFTVPEAARPMQTRLRLELVGGGPIAQTAFDFAIIPTEAKRAPRRLTCAVQGGVELGALAQRLKTAGATVNADAQVEVAAALDAPLARRLAAGGRVLLLASPSSVGPAPFCPLRIEDRGARSWSGDWMSNVNWQRSELFPHLPRGKITGMAYESVTPKAVISSVGAEDAGDILAGIFTGWMNDPAALTAQFRVGDGVLLVTTFDLAGGYGTDPMATAMMHDLLEYLRADRPAPAATLDLSGM